MNSPQESQRGRGALIGAMLIALAVLGLVFLPPAEDPPAEPSAPSPHARQGAAGEQASRPSPESREPITDAAIEASSPALVGGQEPPVAADLRRVYGHTSHGDGTPAAESSILLFDVRMRMSDEGERTDHEFSRLASTSSDAKGWWEIRVASLDHRYSPRPGFADTFLVCAFHKPPGNLVAHKYTVDPAAASPLSMAFDSPATVSGIVVDAATSRPISGARVHFSNQLRSEYPECDEFPDSVQVRADDGGCFTIRPVQGITKSPYYEETFTEASCFLIVSHDDYDAKTMTVKVSPGVTREVEFALTPKSPQAQMPPIALEVFDDSGDRLPNSKAIVLVLAESGGGFGTTLTAGPDGRIPLDSFRLKERDSEGLRHGGWKFFADVCSPGHECVRVDLRDAFLNRTPRIPVTLKTGPVVQGRVVDAASGVGQPGVEVQAWLDKPQGERHERFQAILDTFGAIETTSGDDGLFSLGVPFPDTYSIGFPHPGREPDRSLRLQIEGTVLETGPFGVKVEARE